MFCLGALLLLSCKDRGTTALTGQLTEGPPLVLRTQLGAAFEHADTGDFLYHPTDMALAGENLVIVDNGNDRLVFLDRDLRFVRAVGSTGEGPGELDAPFLARVSTNGIWVAEIDNARFSLFDHAGRFVRTVAHPILLRSFALDSHDALVLPARSLTHHLWRVADGVRTELAPRPDTARGDLATAILRAKRESWVAVTDGDTMHVFDDTYGTLSKHAPSGVLVMRRELPRTLLDTLREEATELARSLAHLGVNEYAVPLIKTISVDPYGYLILTVNSGTTVALRVDPHTYETRRIVVPAMDAFWAFARNAKSLIRSGDRMYILSGEEVRVFDFEERR